jgi:hypothetical protein
MWIRKYAQYGEPVGDPVQEYGLVDHVTSPSSPSVRAFGN